MKNKDIFDLKREFLEYCELDKGQSSLTIAGYDRYLSRFLNWLKSDLSSLGDKTDRPAEPLSPASIDQEAVRRYKLYVNRLKDRDGRELKRSTQNYHILALRAFLRYLAFRGVNSLSPEKIAIAKQSDREVTFLEAEEMAALLNLPDTKKITGLRDRTILEVLFSTGLRVSELAGLNKEEINFERGEIAVLGKGKKLRVVFLSESALHWLDQYLKNSGFNCKPDSEKAVSTPLFLSAKGGRLTVRSIERIVEQIAKRAGIAKHVSPHTFRHSFATDLLIAGADVRSVQSLLGHASITTTQVYTHVTDRHLRDVHSAFHGKTLRENKDKTDTEKIDKK